MSVYEKYFINFKELKPKLLKGFTKVYGEKYSKIIEDRLNGLYLNTYISADHFSNFINKIKIDKEREITAEFLSDLGYDLTAEEKMKISNGYTHELSDEKKKILNMCFSRNEYSENSWSDITAFAEDEDYEKMDDFGKKKCDEKKSKVLNALGANVTKENYRELMTNGYLNQILNKVEKIKVCYKKSNVKYLEFQKEYSEELKEVKRCQEVKKHLEEESSISYLDEISEFLSEDEKQEIIDANNPKKFSRKNIYFNHNLGITPMIESFGSEVEAELASAKDWQKNYIFSDRIKFFKEKGIDLGNNYELYMQSEEVKNIIPNTEFVDKIISIKNKHKDIFKKKYIEQTGSYIENIQKTDKLNLLEPQEFDSKFIESGVICVTTNMVEGSEGKKIKPIVHIPVFNLLKEYSDVLFVHEIGHAIELELLQDENSIMYKTGFEYIESEIAGNNTQEDKSVRRKTEIISEVIHQKLAIEVTDSMHKDGDFLIGNPDIQKIVGGASYENSFPVLRDFYNQYREDIIEGRMSDEGFAKLNQKVPTQLFEGLNSLVNDHSNLPWTSIMFATVEGRETKDTIRHKEIVKEAIELTRSQTILNSAIEATEQVTRTGLINSSVKNITELSKTIESQNLQKGEQCI